MVLLNSWQEFVKIEAWLLLTVFIYLHNQLSSIHSIVTEKNTDVWGICISRSPALSLALGLNLYLMAPAQVVFTSNG